MELQKMTALQSREVVQSHGDVSSSKSERPVDPNSREDPRLLGSGSAAGSDPLSAEGDAFL